MGRAVIIDPGDALPGSYCDRRRCESKVDNRHLSASLRRRRRGWLDDDLAWRVAYLNRRRLTGREVDDGNIVRALVGHVRGFSVAGRSRPVRLFADRDATRWLVRRRVEQEQLARALHNGDTERRAVRITDEVRRYARRNLRNDPVRGRIQHLDRADPRLSKVEQLTVVAKLSIARRLIERQGANDAARSQVDQGEPEVARFLYCDIRELAVGADRDCMRLGHGQV